MADKGCSSAGKDEDQARDSPASNKSRKSNTGDRPMDDPLPSEAAGMKEGAETRPASSTVSGESSLFIEDSQAGELGKEKSSMAVFSPQEASETQREDPESPDSETPSGRRAPRAAVSKANRMNYDMKHHPADEEIRPAAAKKARARYHDLLARDKGEGGMDKQVTKRI